MAIVLAVMALSAVLVAPAFARLGTEQPRAAASALLALLRDARGSAIERNTVVTLRLDPVSGHYRADSSGIRGSGVLATGRDRNTRDAAAETPVRVPCDGRIAR